MCLILIVWRTHPEFPCVLAANRDEYHDRPSASAAWWPNDADILAGRDLKSGGTWLGVTREGRFAALTNFRDGRVARADAPSRGGLVAWALQSRRSVPDTLDYLRAESARYNAFNMIVSDGQRLGVFESVIGEGRELDAGIYGLSNDLLDTPWPKVQNAKSGLAAALAGMHDETDILKLLRDARPAADADLPRTGLSLEWERLLSSAFVHAQDYGTRCSTVFRLDRSGYAYFDEWSWDRAGRETERNSYRFCVQTGASPLGSGGAV
ncbi:MAG TPA: NRDE family protein [Steroidobacteraceae bacterium]|nr:NRDE family protein [Steroidobacteraceae bacterium]